ncbi:hypothetical protein OIO90_006116 [Microbotryomycetes sp. JL221]|nr:hypothetical protein OIO90_006116 [Microbotryomycetes sp. JL221]
MTTTAICIWKDLALADIGDEKWRVCSWLVTSPPTTIDSRWKAVAKVIASLGPDKVNIKWKGMTAAEQQVLPPWFIFRQKAQPVYRDEAWVKSCELMRAWPTIADFYNRTHVDDDERPIPGTPRGEQLFKTRHLRLTQVGNNVGNRYTQRLIELPVHDEVIKPPMTLRKLRVHAQRRKYNGRKGLPYLLQFYDEKREEDTCASFWKWFNTSDVPALETEAYWRLTIEYWMRINFVLEAALGKELIEAEMAPLEAVTGCPDIRNKLQEEGDKWYLKMVVFTAFYDHIVVVHQQSANAVGFFERARRDLRHRPPHGLISDLASKFGLNGLESKVIMSSRYSGGTVNAIRTLRARELQTRMAFRREQLSDAILTVCARYLLGSDDPADLQMYNIKLSNRAPKSLLHDLLGNLRAVALPGLAGILEEKEAEGIALQPWEARALVYARTSSE